MGIIRELFCITFWGTLALLKIAIGAIALMTAFIFLFFLLLMIGG